MITSCQYSPVEPSRAQYSLVQSSTAKYNPGEPTRAQYSALKLNTLHLIPALPNIAQYSPLQSITAQYSPLQLQPTTAQYSPIQPSTAQYSPYQPSAAVHYCSDQHEFLQLDGFFHGKYRYDKYLQKCRQFWIIYKRIEIRQIIATQ